MNSLKLIAVIFIFVLGIIHSVLGERLIFRFLRKEGKWIETNLNGLRVRQIRALWSTWHLATLFAWSLAAIFFLSAQTQFQSVDQFRTLMADAVGVTFAIATLFWYFGTKGKHPAWIVFMVIALLAWFGR